MKTLSELEDFITEQSKSTCKGKVYRVQDNNFLASNGSYHTHRTYKLLKRRSCKGCVHCGWIDDAINEGTAVIDGGNTGDLVTLIPVNEKRDWETGCVDEFDLQFIVVKEEKKDGI